MPRYSEWSRWATRADLEGIEWPGVYVIAVSAVDIDGSAFTWLREVCYVGMTNSQKGLRGRLQQFEDTWERATPKHGGADRVRDAHPDFGTLAPRLYVAVKSFRCDVTRISRRSLLVMGEVARAEYHGLSQYVRRYGSLPQFNNRSDSPKFSKLRPPAA